MEKDTLKEQKKTCHPLAMEKINLGKNYADYIRDEEERKLQNLLKRSHPR